MTQTPDPHFKDIIVEDSNPHKLDPGAYIEGPSGIISDPTPPSDLDHLRKLSKIVKYSSLVLSLCTLFYIIPGAWPLVLTFTFPIVGFVAAHKFSDCLNKFYLIYLSLILIVQIIVMGVLGHVAYIVLQTFVMIAEIVVMVFDAKLVMALNKLDPKDRKELVS